MGGGGRIRKVTGLHVMCIVTVVTITSLKKEALVTMLEHKFKQKERRKEKK